MPCGDADFALALQLALEGEIGAGPTPSIHAGGRLSLTMDACDSEEVHQGVTCSVPGLRRFTVAARARSRVPAAFPCSINLTNCLLSAWCCSPATTGCCGAAINSNRYRLSRADSSYFV